LFGLVQGLAIDSSHRLFGYSPALVVQLDLRRQGPRFLEPGVYCFEFGHRGVDVLDVEEHLQCDSTLLVETP